MNATLPQLESLRAPDAGANDKYLQTSFEGSIRAIAWLRCVSAPHSCLQIQIRVYLRHLQKVVKIMRNISFVYHVECGFGQLLLVNALIGAGSRSGSRKKRSGRENAVVRDGEEFFWLVAEEATKTVVRRHQELLKVMYKICAFERAQAKWVRSFALVSFAPSFGGKHRGLFLETFISSNLIKYNTLRKALSRNHGQSTRKINKRHHRHRSGLPRFQWVRSSKGSWLCSRDGK